FSEVDLSSSSEGVLSLRAEAMILWSSNRDSANSMQSRRKSCMYAVDFSTRGAHASAFEKTTSRACHTTIHQPKIEFFSAVEYVERLRRTPVVPQRPFKISRPFL